MGPTELDTTELPNKNSLDQCSLNFFYSKTFFRLNDLTEVSHMIYKEF